MWPRWEFDLSATRDTSRIFSSCFSSLDALILLSTYEFPLPPLCLQEASHFLMVSMTGISSWTDMGDVGTQEASDQLAQRLYGGTLSAMLPQFRSNQSFSIPGPDPDFAKYFQNGFISQGWVQVPKLTEAELSSQKCGVLIYKWKLSLTLTRDACIRVTQHFCTSAFWSVKWR